VSQTKKLKKADAVPADKPGMSVSSLLDTGGNILTTIKGVTLLP
jgi:hypothetical protein